MKPLLLLHGALGSETQLNPLKLSLADTGRPNTGRPDTGGQVYSLNFSGHSGQPFKKDFGIEVFAQDVIDFLDTQHLDQADIFGYSMGGYVALWLALKHPGRVGKIVTLGTKYDWNEISAEQETRKLNAEKILEKVPAFAKILEQRHAPNDWKELLHKTSAMMLGLGKNPLLTDEVLVKIKNDILILLGDEDDMADMAYSAKVSEILCHGDFLLLENTPHPIEKVDQALLKKRIVTFFNN